MQINDKDWFDQEFLKNLTEDDAARLIENAVYQACHLYERLEGVGKIRGNGHHMMQNIAAQAGTLMHERWVK